ncbi:MAG: hypothetical protein QOI89_3239 [Solirubrobacteraceae bacterium]|nr:hypothetical protein [Solirubrobacteraceae bacterium]
MLFRSPAKRARLLALMLLASLAWGSTVELTHHHGVKAAASLSGAAQSPAADDATATQISSSETSGTSSNSKTGGECLICQLHQNLSTTIIAHTPGDGPTETLALRSAPSAVVHLSEFTSTGQGRAPPSIL